MRGARRCWVIAVAVVLAVQLGGCAPAPDEPAGTSSSTQSGPPSGAATSSLSGTFPANGRELFLECWGTGEPTMVLEVGEGRLHDDMAALRTVYESRLRVCTYDRANKGASGTAPVPRGGTDLVADLHDLLAAAHVPGPYLLVGHSAGGLLVQAYAAIHPDEVAGVVALNPVPPWRLWSSLALPRMSHVERQLEVDYMGGANGEDLGYRDVSRVIDAHPVPSTIPFHVVISTAAQCISPDDVCSRTYPAYETVIRGVARRWEQGRFSEVESSHEIHSDNTAAARAAVDDVLSRGPDR